MTTNATDERNRAVATFDAIKAAIVAVARAETHDNLGDVGFYTRDQWDTERNEQYGRRALLTMTFEGPVYALMNEGTSFPDKLVAALDALGVWYDQGYAWSLHVYPKRPTVPTEVLFSDVIAKDARDIDAGADISDAQYLAAAQRMQRDGEVEIDTGANISRSDGGAYVAAWVWVSNDTVR